MTLTKQFYADPHMQLRWVVLGILENFSFCLVLYSIHFSYLNQFNFAWWEMVLVPAAVYLGGLSVVFIHNATHDSFKRPWLNRSCGYIAGKHQLWGFKGWKLMHLIHHQYADNQDRDPHHHDDITFWKFCRVMPFRANAMVRERYREHWDESRTVHWTQVRTIRYFLAAVLVFSGLLFWYMLLSPVVFLLFYLPSLCVMYLLVADVNYSTHPKDARTGESGPVNLTQGLYHRAANIMWFGIYYHANHHRRPLLFNPKRISLRCSKDHSTPSAA